MNIQLAVFLFLPSIIYARVLPAPNGYVDNPKGKIDDKAAGSQEFLSAFLGNVKDEDGSDSKGFSALNSLNDPKDNGKDGSSYDEVSYSYDGPSYEPSYDGYGGHEPSYDDYTSGYNDKEIERMTRSYKASINCREFHHEPAISPQQCHNVKVRDYASDYDHNNPNELAYCRWDMGFDKHDDKQAGCLCPRTKEKCHKKNQCYWYKAKHSDDGDCVHNSERFYNILANLLRKRGKKDFALKIKYSSAGAKGSLPHGPWGPAFFDLDREPYIHPQLEHAFNYNPYSNNYGMSHGYGNPYMDQMPQMYDYGGHHNPMIGYGEDSYGGNRMPNSYNQFSPNPAYSAHGPLHPSIGSPEINPGYSNYNVQVGPYQSYGQPVPGPSSQAYLPYAQHASHQVQAHHSNSPNPIQIPGTEPAPNPVPFTSHAQASIPMQPPGHVQTPNPVQLPGHVQAPNQPHVSGYLQAPSLPNLELNSAHVQATNPIQINNYVHRPGPIHYGY